MSFKRFDQQDVVVSAESVSTPLWSGNVTALSSFYTSSTQVGGPSGDYYYNIYQTGSADESSRTQFSLTYGNKDGKGSIVYNPNVPGKSPTSTIFGQYRSLVLGDEDSDFVFGSIPSNHFYAIAIDRARYKEKLLPGTLDLVLQSGSNSVTLTDNSQVVSTVTFTDSGREYDLVSGSLGTINSGLQVDGHTVAAGSYGKLYPDIGVILLNANALQAPVADGGLDLDIKESSGIIHDDGKSTNIQKAFDLFEQGGKFRIQSEETISSNFVFVRAKLVYTDGTVNSIRLNH